VLSSASSKKGDSASFPQTAASLIQEGPVELRARSFAGPFFVAALLHHPPQKGQGFL
jgi:hypothetical protein